MALAVAYGEKTFVIKTLYGNWELTLEDSNKKLCLIFLRLLKDPITGKSIYTYKEIADAFGYADRRNVHNYWQEFCSCEGKFLDFLLRKRKVDLAVVDALKESVLSNIQSSLAQLCRDTNHRLCRSDLTVSNIQTALEQIPCTVIRNEIVSNWEKGYFHPKEKFILEEVMRALESGDTLQKESALEVLSGIGINPSDEEQHELVQKTQSESVRDLLTPDLPVSNLSERVIQMVFALNLYYWNVPLSRIGMWLGISKSTVYLWVIGLSLALWESIEKWLVNKVKAGRVYIDEKWLKIGGKWHYWFVAIDQFTELPILAHLLPTRTRWSCQWFLIKLKRIGKYPGSIITDGLPGYISAIAKVFVESKHLLCLFHHQQGVSRWLKNHLAFLKIDSVEQVKKKMKKVVQTKDVRTVKRRLKRLENEDEKSNWGIAPWIALTWRKLPQLIPALRDNGYPTTTNAIERFFRTFQRFYKTRGGFHSVVSAKRQLILFLVIYLFTQQVGTGKAPIESIIPETRRMPFYQLINYPLKFGITAIPRQNLTITHMCASENPLCTFEILCQTKI
jgi:transposase-like protein